MNRFQGKAVVVTGAANGIGAASVRKLHAEGAAVAAIDLDTAAIEAAIGAPGERLLALQADVTDRAQVDAAMAAAAQRFGKLHGLVNCAGVRGNGGAQDIDEATWNTVMSVNTDGTYRSCQAFVGELRKSGNGGAIVNFSSTAGLIGMGGRLGYVASKFAVTGMTRAMAIDLGPLGIRVNAVAPGLIRTSMTQYLLADADNARKLAAAHPIGRFGEAEDVAAVVAFLLSDDAGFVTGAILPVDGGLAAGMASISPSK